MTDGYDLCCFFQHERRPVVSSAAKVHLFRSVNIEMYAANTIDVLAMVLAGGDFGPLWSRVYQPADKQDAARYVVANQE